MARLPLPPRPRPLGPDGLHRVPARCLFVVLGAVLVCYFGALGLIFIAGFLRRAVVLLRPHRAVRDGRPRGDAGGGPAAARDRRPAVRAGRHAEAEGRDRRQRRAQRVRHRTVSRKRAVVCATTGIMRRLDRARARGRARARALARRPPRRHGHDARVVRRRPGRLPHPDGVLQRHVRRPPQRQRRSAGRAGHHVGQPRRLRAVVPADPGPVALPRAGRRPGRRVPHRSAVRPGVGADQDQRRDGPRSPPGTCARRSRSTRSSSPLPSPPASASRRCSPPTRRWRSGSTSSRRISADLDRPSA